ncbi:MAG: response regulator [Oscillochloris sp.]|nr:response regulator [Oscillochloris sp.]
MRPQPANLPQAAIGDAVRLRQVVLKLPGDAVKFTGSGEVGLYAAAEAVDAQQDLVTITTRDRGIGMSQAQAEAPTGPQALTILLVEDNPINQEVGRRLLLQLGHRVTVVGDGLAAVQEVAQIAYDVVLMDVQMPKLDGTAATEKIRRLGSAVRQPYIIALTASAMPGDRERFLQAGMNGYLSKPVQIEDLRRVLAEAGHEAGPPDGAESRIADEFDAEDLINWAAFTHFVESFGAANAENVAMVQQLIMREIPPQIAALAAAQQQHDWKRLRDNAHRLRGGCLQIGALALAALCERIEAAPEAHDVSELIAQLYRRYDQTLALLRAQDG